MTLAECLAFGVGAGASGFGLTRFLQSRRSKPDLAFVACREYAMIYAVQSGEPTIVVLVAPGIAEAKLPRDGLPLARFTVEKKYVQLDALDPDGSVRDSYLVIVDGGPLRLA